MSHKVHPLAYRLGINANWKARWFDEKRYSERVREDVSIREYLSKKLRSAGLESIEIERTANRIIIIINTSRPGLIIGRSGAGAESIKKDLEKILRRVVLKYGGDKKLSEIKIEIREVKNPESFGNVVGLSIAEQLERRMPFRRVMKKAMERIMSNKEVEGAKIVLAGRLGGADMSRRESIKEGRMPRNTLRSNLELAKNEAYTTYGVIGVKVWIYKGEKLE
ncbi:MAG: 30S ribosomal protein S3 [Candidatus Spechtbacteria bacterium RIFCSPHIGHO2_02_FULL_43_15b]|uniref:Small ribosomal subunit protein uS3 n=1 Tax=Candidatus Spechtbacteria bacterium RIFCSPHIGHO2_01_FULL_43_30 TaxID=1802158 RepID=A0A1G2H8K4_9BACT|nr:MAG: 30S ribosomal protein S3 [Candidatus Spechtbacteria bacterium RIFCSPHIGHO2_01_FULL_43_30]OGZ59709.1 MAG: 30S ribosomal protein S3 [Candidatus Spechtbacteria bacterium RIFCSPHIGHO2_02_FULL_43_15b]